MRITETILIARRCFAGMAQTLGRLARDQRGVIALKFAFAIPAVSVLTLGSVDLYAVYADKQHLAEIADGAALAGASELGLAVDGAGPEGRAQAFVEGHLAEWPDHPNVQSEIEVVTLADHTRGLMVRLTGHRMSFFGNLLPPGGWHMAADAVASSINVVPLCILVHGEAGRESLTLKDSAEIRAPACLVHSNREIKVEGVASLHAALVQAVRTARGSIFPAATTGAVPLRDPFASLDLDGRILRETLGCTPNGLPRRFSSGRHTLPAGIHCNGIDVEGTAELALAPGEHWFLGGHLTVRDDARLTGSDVVLFFDKKSKFDFKDHALVALDGRETGPYSGLVMATTRDNNEDFLISSDNVESLLGVIYVPSARLIVDGSADVARESAWTVIVARGLELKGSPALFINADYMSSDVPVPAGVGPSSGGSRLID